jgi:hypothetical protein
VNDVITAVGNCSVKNRQDWYECLVELLEPGRAPLGYCIPELAVNIAGE